MRELVARRPVLQSKLKMFFMLKRNDFIWKVAFTEKNQEHQNAFDRRAITQSNLASTYLITSTITAITTSHTMFILTIRSSVA